MNNDYSYARCLAYLDNQKRLQDQPAAVPGPPPPAVAISRQSGSGAIIIADKLAEYLKARGPSSDRPWTVFDKNLLARVLEDHHLPARLQKFLPEDKVNAISDTVDEILGLHPPSWLIVRQSTETILRLAELGNVILVGRGANAITSGLPNVLRVRLIGSVERRLERLRQRESLDHARALELLQRTDRGRARYVRTYFHRNIADPLHYDLTVNTDHLAEEEVARLLGEALLARLDWIRREPERQVA